MPCTYYDAVALIVTSNYLSAFPGRPGSVSMRGRGRGRIPVGGPPGVPPGMPPSGEFPQGMDERGPRPFEEGAPFFPGG